MAINISPENEQLLQEAVAAGRFKTAEEALSEALKMLRHETPNGDSSKDNLLPPEQWAEQFRQWTRKPRQGNPQMDDSRESIYDYRGE